MTESDDQFQQQIQLAKQIQQLENNLKNYLSKEAMTRYFNIKAVNKEKAIQILALITQLVQSGQMKEPMNDAQFKQLLLSLGNQRSSSMHIRKV